LKKIFIGKINLSDPIFTFFTDRQNWISYQSKLSFRRRRDRAR